MANVLWSDHALARMREQVRYIAAKSCSPEIAAKWANDIFAEADKLEDFPRLGHPLPELPDTPYLEVLVRKNFRVIYRIEDKNCLIITVRRTSMLIDETTLGELDSVTG